MRDDFTEMGFSKKDIRELMSIKEPNVDSTGNRPKGVEDAGEARRKRRERGRCYESLFVEGGRASKSSDFVDVGDDSADWDGRLGSF